MAQYRSAETRVRARGSVLEETEGRRRLPRIGIGVDVHAYAAEGSARALWVAGLLWPGERGLDGHSDADVAAHAACDALFSAAGIGDLGAHFGTSRPDLAGASGVTLLPRRGGWSARRASTIGNVAVQVVGNGPRIGSRRGEAEGVLSDAVDAPVSVSGTTTDGLGLTGRGEGSPRSPRPSSRHATPDETRGARSLPRVIRPSPCLPDFVCHSAVDRRPQPRVDGNLTDEVGEQGEVIRPVTLPGDPQAVRLHVPRAARLPPRRARQGGDLHLWAHDPGTAAPRPHPVRGGLRRAAPLDDPRPRARRHPHPQRHRHRRQDPREVGCLRRVLVRRVLPQRDRDGGRADRSRCPAPHLRAKSHRPRARDGDAHGDPRREGACVCRGGRQRRRLLRRPQLARVRRADAAEGRRHGRGRGRRPQRQAGPSRLRALEGAQARRAGDGGLADPVRHRSTGLAPRVLGDGAASTSATPSTSTAGGRPALPPPRERAGPVPRRRTRASRTSGCTTRG